MSKPITLLLSLIWLLGTALGTPALSAQLPDAIWPGQLAFDQAGTVVELVGDCDADGVPDVAIGAPHADQQITFPITFTLDDVGHVQVRSGATGAVLFNLWGTVAGDEFGYALGDAGDIDLDGHDDLLIGVPRATFNKDHQGKVQIRSGATGVLLRTNWGPQAEDRFGHSVSGHANALSSNPAGYYAVGAPLYDRDDATGGYGQEGMVRVFRGDTGATEHNYYGGTHGGAQCSCQSSDYEIKAKHFGWAVDYVDDVLAIGAPLSDRLNTVTGELQTSTGFVSMLRPEAFFLNDRLRYWGAPGARAGTALASLGYRVAIGSPGTVGDGRVEVYGLTGTPQRRIGEVLAFVGDADGAGFSDLALGSPDAPSGFPFGTPGVGALSIVSGADGAPLVEYLGTSANDFLGSAVAGADFDGDGFADLVVGVPGEDGPAGIDTGAAWYHDGNPCPAAAVQYGTGHPGTNGTPQWSYHSRPVLGATFELGLTNSLGAPTQAWFFAGFAPASFPLEGGTLLVDIFLVVTIPMGSGTLPLDPELPDDPSLCGVSLFLQGVVIDPGASHGAAFSRGLEMRFGY